MPEILREDCILCLWKEAKLLSRCLRDARRDSNNSEEDENAIAKRPSEANSNFIRWQETTIGQFGFANNVVLVLTAPSVGFALGRAPASSGIWECILFVGVCVLMLSGVFALLCTYTRLLDFRLTAQIAATKKVVKAKKQGGKAVEELRELIRQSRDTCEYLGCRSWLYLERQMLLFGFGTTTVTVVTFFGI